MNWNNKIKMKTENAILLERYDRVTRNGGFSSSARMLI